MKPRVLGAQLCKDHGISQVQYYQWRDRIGSEGIEKLFYQTFGYPSLREKTAQSLGLLKKSHLNKVNVDAAVREKAIAFPTDARLYYGYPPLRGKMREKLVAAAERRGIDLCQNYRGLSRKALVKQGRYSHAKQMRRARREAKIGHLKTENRLDRNYLKGTSGERVNALLAGCGANLRKLLRAFFVPFPYLRTSMVKMYNVSSKNYQNRLTSFT